MKIKQRISPRAFTKRRDLTWEEIKSRDGVYRIVRKLPCTWYFYVINGEVWCLGKSRVNYRSWREWLSLANPVWEDNVYSWEGRIPK